MTANLTVGQSIGSTPPHEGYLPIVNGSSLNIAAFTFDPTDQEEQEWLKGKAECNVFVKNSIPIILVDIGRLWSFEVYLNLLQEDEKVREAFLGSDPYHPKADLLLISCSNAIVRAIRTIDIDHGMMLRIKEASFEQSLKYPSIKACRQAALKILDNYNANQLRAKAKKTKQV